MVYVFPVHGKNSYYNWLRLALMVLVVKSCIFYSNAFALNTMSFEIPSQEIKLALDAFSDQTNLSVIYKIDDLNNTTTNGLSGLYYPLKALNIMLEGTGLVFEQSSDETISIRKNHHTAEADPKPKIDSSAAATNKEVPLSDSSQANNTDSSQANNTEKAIPSDETPESENAESESFDDYMLEDTIVTATKTGETRLQEVSIAVTALSAEELKTRSTFNLMDIGSPNLSVMSGNNEQNYYIRGIGSENNSYLKEPNVGIYIDGVYMEKGIGAMGDFIDVERVEILRGPQGTIYGRNSTGGAINILTASPTEDFFAKVMLEAASFEKFRADATISGPIVKNKLNGRLTLMGTTWEGHYDIIGDPDDQDNENITVKGALDFKITDDINFILRGDYEDSENRTPMGENFLNDAEMIAAGPFWWNVFPIPLFNPGNTKPFSYVPAPGFYDIIASSPKSYYNKENYGFSGHFTVNLPFNATLRSITAYRSFYREIFINSIFGGFDPSHQKDDVDTFSQELQLDGKAGRINYVVGVFYFRLREDLTIDQDAIYFNPLAAHLNADIGTDAYAAFSSLSYSVTDQFTLRAGLRYSYEEKTVDSIDNRAQFGIVYKHEEGDWDAFTPKVSADYRISEDAMIYGSVSTGFRAGTFALLNIAPMPQTVEPETNLSYEIGFKSDWLDKRLRINAAAFFSQYDDMQVTGVFVNAGVPTVFTSNAEGADIKGVEVEITARPLPPLTLNLSVGYLDGEYTDFIAQHPVTYANIDVSGNQIPYTAKYQMNFGCQYIVDLQDSGFITLRSDVSWKDKIYYNIFNEERLIADSVALVNGFLRWETTDSAWSVEIYGKNLTDKEYYTRLTDFSMWNAVTGEAGLPRTFGLRVGYSF
ncbi:MAG: TonB-dependent receptor [Deltaproteobacteria bacterium]|nr:TonB-dependent receptor [Deltaproteobacteria bacterium]